MPSKTLFLIQKIIIGLGTAPVAAVLLLWLASHFCAPRLGFAVAPCSYDIEALGGALQMESSSDSPLSAPWYFRIDAPQPFDRSDYDNGGERVKEDDDASPFGIFRCGFRDGTGASFDLIALPYALLLAASCLPILVFGAGFGLVRIIRRGTPRPVLATTALASVAVLIVCWIAWPQNKAPSPEAAALLASGRTKEDNGDFTDAVADFTAAIALDPQCAEAYAQRATAELNANDSSADALAKPLADFVRAFVLDSNYALGLANLYAMVADQNLSENHPDLAILNATRAIALDSRNTQVFETRGEARLQQGDCAGALADCNHVFVLGPQRANTYYLRGEAEKAEGELDGAIADFNRALELDNGPRADWLNARAETKKANGDLAGATADFAAANDPMAGI